MTTVPARREWWREKKSGLIFAVALLEVEEPDGRRVLAPTHITPPCPPMVVTRDVLHADFLNFQPIDTLAREHLVARAQQGEYDVIHSTSDSRAMTAVYVVLRAALDAHEERDRDERRRRRMRS